MSGGGPAPMGVDPDLLEVGTQLRTTRERQGLSLEQVAESTHIRIAFLAALEEGRVGALPGEVFVKGFTRIYGNVLGLDGAALVETLKQGQRVRHPVAPPAEGPAAARRRMRARRKVLRARRRPARRGRGLLLGILAVLILVAAGATLWHLFHGRRSLGPITGTASTSSAAAAGASQSGTSARQGPSLEVASRQQASDGWHLAYLVGGQTDIRLTLEWQGGTRTRRWVDGATQYTDEVLQQGTGQVRYQAQHQLEVEVWDPAVLTAVRIDGMPAPSLPPPDGQKLWLEASLATLPGTSTA